MEEAAPPSPSPKALAIDIGGSKLLCGLVEGGARIVATRNLALPRRLEAVSLVDLLARESEQLLRSKPNWEPCGVGIAVPGLVDSSRGLWKHAPYSGLNDVPIADQVSKRLGLPVAIENDVNACALAEKAHGACRSDSDFLWLTISNGIGGALCLSNRLYRGLAGHAGEIGHLKVVESGGALCDCGRRGCLEAHASGRAIAGRYRERAGTPDTDAREVAERARDGDAIARAAFAQAGRYVGRAIAHAANLLNLPTAIIGGGVSQSLDLLLPALRRELDDNLFAPANPRVEVRGTALGYYAALVGAATLVDARLAAIHL